MRNLLTRRHDPEQGARDTAGERVVDRRAAKDEPTTQRVVTGGRAVGKGPVIDDRPVVADRKAVEERPATDDTAAKPARRWAHVSAMATLSLILGVLAIATSLTGLLAAEGIVLGVVSGAIAAGGLVAASRRGVTGHSLALLGLIAGLGAILLGVLAIGGELSWLDSKTDEVARLHHWLLAQMPWLKHF